MKIVNVESENTLRSVGNPPNGIVVVVWTEQGPSFAVDPKWEPKKAGVEAVRVHGSPTSDAVPITPAEIVEAADGDEELVAIRSVATFAFIEAVNGCLPAGKIDLIQVYLDFLKETRDAIATATS
jgi:hypothetical protein